MVKTNIFVKLAKLNDKGIMTTHNKQHSSKKVRILDTLILTMI
jgi:hypothetical protein